MFEAIDVAGEELADCADALLDSVCQRRRVSATRMARVARWADLHSKPERSGPGFAGHGTPQVTPEAVAELGLLLQTTTHSAAVALRDALDLRHRHPRLWRGVMTGQIDDYRAAEVARRTRAAELTLAQARKVDAAVVEALTSLPYGRAITVVEAEVIAADPVGHQARLDEAAAQRYVATSRADTATGLRTMIARTTIGDVARFDAMLAHLAGLLDDGADHHDTLQVRRARAFALLADPARACLVLAGGTASQADAPAEGPAEGRAEDPELAEPPTAPQAAVELGRLLHSLGPAALDRLRPRWTFYVHLSEQVLDGSHQVVRVEGLGPAGVQQLAEWLGSDRVSLTPVLDLRRQRPVDGYEVPRRMREALVTARPHEVWPWGTLASRHADLDHTVPYRPPDAHGPPGQTRVGNLGPLSRRHHNAKTSGGFVLHQPLLGLYVWRSPSGHWFEVDPNGRSRALGRDTPAMLQLPPGEQRLARLAAGV